MAPSGSCVMNFFIYKFRIRPRVDLELLSDLIDHGSESQVIKDILNFDLSDEIQIRSLLDRKNYLRYLRVGAITDQRKALTIVLSSIRQQRTLINRLLKESAYPVFLFGVSLMMLMFVDRILLQTFQTMLAFLGPLNEVSSIQGGLRILIGIDIVLIGIVLVLLVCFKRAPNQLYQLLNQIKTRNIWSSLVSHQLCTKFFMFYRLGNSVDQIFSLIRDSSDPILAQRCADAIKSLQNGAELHEAVALIDPKLSSIFRLSEEGVDIESYLDNHNRIQERLIAYKIKRAGRGLLAYDYIQIALIILVIYQMMLKPIEMMGNYL